MEEKSLVSGLADTIIGNLTLRMHALMRLKLPNSASAIQNVYDMYSGFISGRVPIEQMADYVRRQLKVTSYGIGFAIEHFDMTPEQRRIAERIKRSLEISPELTDEELFKALETAKSGLEGVLKEFEQVRFK